MKILITGHRGFIGSNLYHALKNVHQVEGYEWGEKFPGYDYDTIIHVGAISSTVERNVEKIMAQNYDFSVDLLENCNKFGVNLQFASSAAVYGNNREFKETSPVDPRSPYAWSKYLFERYVLSKNWSIVVQCFRYFNVYGPGEEHKGSQASPQHKFQKQFEKQGFVELFEGSENFSRDFVPVEQVVKTHCDFLTINQSGIFNIGTGQARSFLEIAQEITNNHKFVQMPVHIKNQYQTYTCADMTKTLAMLKKNNFV
jgi:ADP-L-glycero-D-manno-heptose 6-epimerase